MPVIQDYLAKHYGHLGPGVELSYLEGSEYRLEECFGCGLVYQKEIPGPALMVRLYEQWLDPKIENKRRNTHYYLWSAAQIAHGIDILDRLPGEVSFLDFGMGWGHWCLIAKGFGCASFGMDLSDVRSEQASRSGITVLGRDDLVSHRFDFINAEQVFEHIADPLGTLMSFVEALNPGGVVRISVPRGWDIKPRLQLKTWQWGLPDSAVDSLMAVAPLEHINCFNYRALEAMGERAGLASVEPSEGEFVAQKPSDALKLLVLPAYRRLLPGLSSVRREKRRELGRSMRSVIYLRRLH